MFTVVYDRRPTCHTCHGYLESWIMFHPAPRCERCEKRLVAVMARKVCHDAFRDFFTGMKEKKP